MRKTEEAANLRQCKWAECQRSFLSCTDLFCHLGRDHMGKSVRGQETNLTCAWEGCGKTSKTSYNFKRHIQSHARLTVKCDLCQKEMREATWRQHKVRDCKAVSGTGLDSRSSSPDTADQPSPGLDQGPRQPCLWKEGRRACGKEFATDNELYAHLCEAHVQNKSAKKFKIRIGERVCLWDDCHEVLGNQYLLTFHFQGHVNLASECEDAKRTATANDTSQIYPESSKTGYSCLPNGEDNAQSDDEVSDGFPEPWGSHRQGTDIQEERGRPRGGRLTPELYREGFDTSSAGTDNDEAETSLEDSRAAEMIHLAENASGSECVRLRGTGMPAMGKENRSSVFLTIDTRAANGFPYSNQSSSGRASACSVPHTTREENRDVPASRAPSVPRSADPFQQASLSAKPRYLPPPRGYPYAYAPSDRASHLSIGTGYNWPPASLMAYSYSRAGSVGGGRLMTSHGSSYVRGGRSSSKKREWDEEPSDSASAPYFQDEEVDRGLNAKKPRLLPTGRTVLPSIESWAPRDAAQPFFGSYGPSRGAQRGYDYPRAPHDGGQSFSPERNLPSTAAGAASPGLWSARQPLFQGQNPSET